MDVRSTGLPRPIPRLPTRRAQAQAPFLGPDPARGDPGDRRAPTTLGVSLHRALPAPRAAVPHSPPLTREVPAGVRARWDADSICAARGADGLCAPRPAGVPVPSCPPPAPGHCLTHLAGQSQGLLPARPLLILSCPLPSILASAVRSPSPWHPSSGALPSPQPDHGWDPSPLPFYTIFVHMTST